MVAKARPKAKKSFGQCFLEDRPTLQSMCQAASLSTDDNVLEVGPGYGTLTDIILENTPHSLTLVETDKELYNILAEKYSDTDIEIVLNDFLQYPLENLSTPYKVIANIPYYISTPIIEKILLSNNIPEVLVLMVQKEYAEKVVAEAPHTNSWSIFVQLRADVEYIQTVPRHLFSPSPKVDSAILKITPKKGLNTELLKKVTALSKTAFSKRRKKLSNSLQSYISEEHTKSEILTSYLTKRPEELSVEEWIFLSSLLFSK